MAIASLCIVLGIILVTAWGVGSLMKTIGTLRGWNLKRTFWVSTILYALPMIAIYTSVNLGVLQDSSGIAYVMFIAGGIGILSPIINLRVKRVYPDIFKKTTPNQADENLKNHVTVEKESSAQKHRSFSSGSDQQNKPETAKLSVDSKNFKPNTNVVSSRVFISYRRSDSADIAGRIYDRLIGSFGEDPIFKDVDSIPLGLDFKEFLDRKVGECSVLLAIIGDRWLEASDASGKRRLDDPADFVRIEIESALERGIPVIPLLVRGATMPPEERLPSSLQKLVYRNGIPVRADPDFHRDMDRLISALEKYV